MNPTVPEEVGQTARSFIDALKSQPAVLALIISNIGLLVFIFYALSGAAQFRNDMLAHMIELQKACVGVTLK